MCPCHHHRITTMLFINNHFIPDAEVLLFLHQCYHAVIDAQLSRTPFDVEGLERQHVWATCKARCGWDGVSNEPLMAERKPNIACSQPSSQVL